MTEQRPEADGQRNDPHQPHPQQPYARRPDPGQPGPQQPYRGQPGPQQPYAGQPYPGRPTVPAYFQPPPVVPTLPKAAYGPWGKRVLASLIDYAPSLVGLIFYGIGYGLFTARLINDPGSLDSGSPVTGLLNPLVVIGLVLLLAALPWAIYNRWIKGGRTGQSLGKRVVGLTLLSEQTGAPVGAGMAFLRDLVHALDSVAYVGYLWPLWDEKRQTFADKLMQTVVLPAPTGTPGRR